MEEYLKIWLTWRKIFFQFPYVLQQPISRQLEKIDRPFDIPDIGVISDLTWADPDEKVFGYADSPRGAGRSFGPNAVKKFLQMHNLDLVVRAHQVVMDGYEFFADRQLVTVFSAPSYCGQFDNAAAVMNVDDKLLCTFTIFRPDLKVGDFKKKDKWYFDLSK